MIRLPVAENGHIATVTEEPLHDRRVENLRILIVDDNSDAAESLGILLRMKGNTVRTANDGEEAIRKALEFEPDVVLCDIGLPKMSGYEVCQALKERMASNGILFIAVTGWGQESDRLKSREAGFDHHLVKPVDPQQIFAIIEDLMGQESQ